MFRSSTIIRELALNLAKSYIYVKAFGETTLLFIMRLRGSMSWNGVCCMLCRMRPSRILHSCHGGVGTMCFLLCNTTVLMCLLLNFQLTFQSQVHKYHIHIQVTQDMIQLCPCVCARAQ